MFKFLNFTLVVDLILNRSEDSEDSEEESEEGEDSEGDCSKSIILTLRSLFNITCEVNTLISAWYLRCPNLLISSTPS